jgi:hypothetical protein
MDGNIATFLDADPKYILYALLFIVAAISAFAQHSLFNNLKRYDPSQWVALGSPKLFRLPTKRDFTGMNSIKDENRFLWYIFSMKYRRSDSQKIRTSGDAVFGSGVALWVTFIFLLSIGG